SSVRLGLAQPSSQRTPASPEPWPRAPWTAFFPSFLTTRPPPSSTLFPYTTLFRSRRRALRSGRRDQAPGPSDLRSMTPVSVSSRSEEHTSELQSPYDLVCRLLPEKKNDLRPSRVHARE